MSHTPQIPKDLVPFDGIGLCFSGGGYRATFFDLGVVSYLNRIHYNGDSLLSKVRAVSTVSGGTLLGVAFAKAAQEKGYKFEDFYTSFYNAFTPENDKLLPTAISKLENSLVWKANAHKKRSLINAFALTYSEMDFFKGNFDVFENPTHPVLQRVCFNSTEFSFGLAFRFQNSGVFGNSPLRCSELNDLKYQVPLGDIVASSSCFPMGFEPMVFPDDYIVNQSSAEYKALKKVENFKDGVGVMDGGIGDNQGIKSMLNISRQSKVRDRFNLLIVNDVSSYKMAPWVQDSSKVKKKMTLKSLLAKIASYFTLNPLYWITVLIGVTLIVLNSMKVLGDVSYPWVNILGGFLTGVGLLLTIFGKYASGFKNKTEENVRNLLKNNVPEALLDDVLSFENLEVGLLKRMMIDRLTSTFKMVHDVFLKQIRRLNYEILYDLEELDYRRMTATVYELNGKESPYKNHKFNEGISEHPSAALTKSALIASETPTTLWWGKEDVDLNRLGNLVACGQFTTCYSLMVYILDLKEAGLDTPELQHTFKALENDWKQLNADPLRWV